MPLKNGEQKPIRDFDVTEWHGPLMLLKVKNFLDQLGPGQKARIIAPTNKSGHELLKFIQAIGHQLLEITTARGKQVFLVRPVRDNASQGLAWPKPDENPPPRKGG
ncbi:sulfurtransferase TusA family protein [Dethiosulfatarculus sandiegensis]|uniref:Uncharacterized protein n=1 Tax=Dethiosulfatarculus sandiegensis TaxID=1429043 RepID=A0A0D2HJZ8_9BACT|nr:hypothetical protein [Dethiosulfatarculus sandiegensis]KIX10968.1 hypothetical protein X474_26620 [Dethiosulfatarculus sandiegensis]